MLLMIALIVVAGMIGGLFNAYFADGGFIWPRSTVLDGRKIWQPGWMGNVAAGGITSLVLWGLYGPLAHLPVITVGENSVAPMATFLSLSQLVGALLSGVGGSRVLSNEVEKQFLTETKRQLTGALSKLASDGLSKEA